jgi:hypothetical protein
MSYLHLARLKGRILPAEIATQTRYDERLSALAAGVAAAFDRYTSRLLVRAASQVETVPGGARFYSLARYPVESITSAILTDQDGGTETLTVARLNKAAGLVHFDATPGTDLDSIAITLTGGLWCDTSEFLNGTLPTGASAMPADLIDAFVLQVDHEARVRKIFGGTSSEDLSADLPKDFDLIPRVERALKYYQRII